MVRHKRGHTGDKPYECDVCNQRFARRSHLIKRKLIFQNTKSKSNKSNYEAIKKELKKRAEKRGAVFEKCEINSRN